MIGRYPEAVASLAIPASPVPIVEWGQSNAAGQGITQQTGTPIAAPMAIFNIGTSMSRTREFGVTDWVGVRHGVQIQLVKDLVAAGKNPVIATAAHNAIGMANWVPTTAVDWPVFRDNLAPTINRVSSSIKRHVVVMHGETDGGGSGSANSYAANLVLLAAQIRAVIGACRFYIVGINTHMASVTFRSTIRTQQLLFVSGDPDAEFIDTDAVTCTNDPHYVSAEYNTVASLISARILLQI